ncbi:MAG: lipoyl(octanoyl) transferase LipB [Gemmatimonadota bacterium]|nr:lipoyl(octanoyl) transferase LipB [Gemmatimonadota bacterium]
MTAARLLIADLGRVPYAAAHRLQHALRERRIAGSLASDVMLLLEHEATVTLGRGTRASSLPVPTDELARRGITIAEVERGGDVTWHGPGQLVGYPILDLSRHREDLHWYLRQVEEVLIGTLADLGITAGRNPGYTGVWTRGRKIASIGVHVRHWVTTHGFALNVSNDTSGFDLIVPCGIQDVEMTSVQRELAGAVGTELPQRAIAAVTRNMGRVFGLTPSPVELAELLPDHQDSPEVAATFRNGRAI